MSTLLPRLRLGILVPSSNTEMEPAITSIIQTINTNNSKSTYITAHFSRLRVTQISLDSSSASQFTLETMLSAVSLLADADVHAIAWGGTSAGWLGIETDRTLCTAIYERFGIPATTATLALLEYMAMLPSSARKLGLLTPYVQRMNDAICANFAKEGIEVVADKCLSITENRVIAEVTTQQLGEMLDEVMTANPDVKVVTVFCTNVSAVGVLQEWEGRYTDTSAGAGREFTVLDSVALTVWGALRKADVDIKGLRGREELGRLFAV